jgi:uncharacterized protein
MDKRIVMFCLCASIAVFVIPSMIFAASFDCGKAASEVEKLICSDAELSRLDESLNKAYLQALERTLFKKQTIKSQRQWVKNERNACQNAAREANRMAGSGVSWIWASSDPSLILNMKHCLTANGI